MDMYGPVPGDTVFIHAFNHEYDAVVTLFHDQGQIATKLHSFDVGITVAAGLPFAITTPEHGTAFDIAGKGIAKTLPQSGLLQLQLEWHLQCIKIIEISKS